MNIRHEIVVLACLQSVRIVIFMGGGYGVIVCSYRDDAVLAVLLSQTYVCQINFIEE